MEPRDEDGDDCCLGNVTATVPWHAQNLTGGMGGLYCEG